MTKIYCLPEKKYVEVKPSDTILQGLLAADIPHTNVCGGNAYCSTCRIMVLDGIDECSVATPNEKVLAKKLDFPVHIRLACQTKILGDSAKVTVRRMVLDDEDLDVVDSQLCLGNLGSKRPLAMLLVNIGGVSNFDEINFPYDIIYVIGKFFNRLNKITQKYGGVINNYMGVQTITIFGVEDSDRIAERAVWAGLEIVKSVQELNNFLKQLQYKPLAVSVGIHYGPSVLIAVDPTRPNMVSAIGNLLNQTSLIAAANKDLGTELLISETVYSFIKEKAVINRIRSLKLPEQNNELRLIEVTKMEGEEPIVVLKNNKTNNNNRGTIGQRIGQFWQKFSGSWGK